MNAQYLKEQFEQLKSGQSGSGLREIQDKAFQAFHVLGVPGVRDEEWKYTRIGSLFKKEFHIPAVQHHFNGTDLQAHRLPGHDHANELVFVNGLFSQELSVVRSASLIVLPLEEAAKGKQADIVRRHLGHSSDYLKDGINALNTAFLYGSLFIQVKRGLRLEHPIYIYHIADARHESLFAQPRSLVHIDENARAQMVETFVTIGEQESFTNQVMEVVVEKDAHFEYYKIQSDVSKASQVSTTHVRQIGKSYTHLLTLTLGGGIVRNNTNVIMEAERCESHLYGLYFQRDDSHVDNHTIVDNVLPNCFSNELYKGMLDGNSTGVFNGKIYVRQAAQKTNAFQSNKNVLLSDTATVNTKPQLEIFADDVKCSHGCTVGQLNEEGLFYLQSRGVPEKIAKSMLLQGFAADIIEKIELQPIREYAERLIAQRLEFDIS